MKNFLLYCVICMMLIAGNSSMASTVPLAHTRLQAQAEVSYLPAGEAEYAHELSNYVYLEVLPVEALQLEAGDTLRVNPAQQVVIPALLRNTGNTPSRYRFSIQSESASLLQEVKLYQDLNGNGHVDNYVRQIAATGVAEPGGGELQLQPGEAVALLIAGTAARNADGKMVLQLHVETVEQKAEDNRNVSLVFSDGPAMRLSHAASAFLVQHGRAITFQTKLENVGSSEALVADNIDGTPIRIDGSSVHAIMVRSAIPERMRYVLRSMSSVSADAIVLVRAKSDPAWSYRSSSKGLEASDVAEVAVALKSNMDVRKSLSMKFKLVLADDVHVSGSGSIEDRAEAFHLDGVSPATRRVESNLLSLTVDGDDGPDLLPHLSHVGVYSPGHNVSYSASLSNVGNAPTQGEMRMSLQFPDNVDVISLHSSGWVCDGPGSRMLCRNAQSLDVGAQSTVVNIVARLKAHAVFKENQTVDVVLEADGGGESEEAKGNNRIVDSALMKKSLSLSGHVWLDTTGTRRLDGDDVLLQGWRAQLLAVGQGDASTKIVAETTTDGHGLYEIDGVVPGLTYALRILSPTGQLLGTPQDGEAGKPLANAKSDRRHGWMLYKSFKKSYAQQSLSLRPSGVVYNSVTRQPVAGARVTLNSEHGGFQASQHTLGGSATAVTDSHGFYFFTLTPEAPVDTYSVEVEAEGYAAGMSRILPPQTTAFVPSSDGMPSPAADQLAIPTGDVLPVYYSHFIGGGTTDRMINNHLALDPASGPGLEGLVLKKTVNRKTVEVIDMLTYSLKLSHKLALPISGFNVMDDLPAGFTYIRGSSRLLIGGGQSTAIKDPEISGKRMFYAIDQALPPNSEAELTYRVAVGATVHVGVKATNRARATSGLLVSNEATASVNVVGGIFADDAFVAGKVFMDCDGSPLQGTNSPGVPGVRIYLEDGSYAETDVDGKYSLYGLKPVTHALKIDTSTLPADTRAIPLDHRNLSGDGRFLDVKNGELARGDFALSCSDIGRAEIAVRRARLSAASELSTALSESFQAEYLRNDQTDVKMRPASGVIRGAASVSMPEHGEVTVQEPAGLFGPLAENNTTQPKDGPSTAPVSIDQLLRQASPELDFVNLQPGQVMAGAQTTVRVKGRSGMTFALAVNGTEVHLSHVGQRSTLPSRGIAAWEYLGVNLQPGKNTLTVQELDAGKVVHEKSISIVVPGKLARIIVHTPANPIADPTAPFPVRIDLQDKDGVPVAARMPLTLRASNGDWQGGAVSREGTQVMVADGRASFGFVPPEQTGEITLTVSGGAITTETKVTLQPKLRPMVATGILEGVISLRNRRIEQADGNNGFERELRGLSHNWGDGKSGFGSRAAFFLKGKVKGEYLLTAAFDSDKQARERLFRDIEPDRYYPIYGDSSVRGFDAQSTSRLYLRVDKGTSYLVYGDFATASGDDVRQLTQYDRGVTGIKQHYEKGTFKGNVFVSRDNLVQRIQEIRANGTTMFPDAFGADYVANSERIEIITRQRDQHGLIVGQPRTLTPFADYSVDEFGNLRLKVNVPSINPDTGNLNFIRITYESDGNGPSFWLYGVDGTVEVLDGLTLGGVVVKDQNPADPRSLYGATIDAALGGNNRLVGEYGQTESLKKGTGQGARIELTHDGERIQASASALATDAGFDNLSSSVTSGKTEYRAKASTVLDADNTLKVEAIHTNSDDSQIDRTQFDRSSIAGGSGVSLTGAQVMLERRLTNNLTVEVGSRVASGTIQSSGGTENVNNVTARTRLKVAIPGMPAASVFGEYEMDVRDSAKRSIALGGDYQLKDHSRLYVRRELMSSLGSMYEFNTGQRTFRTLAGIERPFSKSGKVFSEYRQGGAIDGRDAQAAYGLRDGWEVQPGLLLHANFERTDSRGANASGSSDSSTAIAGAVEYLANPRWKGSTSVELRQATQEDSTLLTGGLAFKINSDWSLLGKAAWYQIRGRGANAHSDSLRTRLRMGAAYRPVNNNALNALAYYERRVEKGNVGTGMQDDRASLRTVDLVSAHANWQPLQHWTLSGRYAGKQVTERGAGQGDRVSGNLFSGRVTRDIGKNWDVGVSSSVMLDNMHQKRYAVGGEVGYMVKKDLWLSIGYNKIGFEDREFGRMADTSQGVFFRMRYRFDENS